MNESISSPLDNQINLVNSMFIKPESFFCFFSHQVLQNSFDIKLIQLHHFKYSFLTNSFFRHKKKSIFSATIVKVIIVCANPLKNSLNVELLLNHLTSNNVKKDTNKSYREQWVKKTKKKKTKKIFIKVTHKEEKLDLLPDLHSKAT